MKNDNIKKIVRKLTKLSPLLLIMLLSACVTTIENPKPKIDKQKILESNIRLGMAYLQQEKRDNALLAFTKALKIDKKSAEAHQGMALVHNLNGEFEQAEKSFRKALNSRADFSLSDIQYTFGRFLLNRNRCADAFPLFEKASKDLTFRRRANALFELGQCAEKGGNVDRAVASYRHALNINPKFAPAAIELAHKSFTNGDYAQAKKYLDQFSKNARQSARSLWLGIRIERIFGNKDKEASYVLALKNLHPYSQEYLQYKQLIESEK